MTRALYSLCGADERHFFSPHCWKAVMALAHKGLDFEEVPTTYSRIAGIGGGFSKTVPVLDDNGRLISDSFDIALYLEEAYPDRPSLFGGEGGKALSRLVEGYSQMIIHPAIMFQAGAEIIIAGIDRQKCCDPEERDPRPGRVGENGIARRARKQEGDGDELQRRLPLGNARHRDADLQRGQIFAQA